MAEHLAKQGCEIFKRIKKMTTTLKLSNSLKSNKDMSYRVLAQIASRFQEVRADSVDYDGKRQVITGIATGKWYLQLIRNLQSKSYILSSLSSIQ